MQAIVEIIEDGKDYLSKWRSFIEELFPTHQHDTPDPEELSLKNCDSSAFTIDTCNQAYKSRTLLVCRK